MREDEHYVPPFLQKLRNAKEQRDVHHAFVDARFVPELPKFSKDPSVDFKFWRYMQKRREPRFHEHSDDESYIEEVKHDLEKVKEREERNVVDRVRRTSMMIQHALTFTKIPKLPDEDSDDSDSTSSLKDLDFERRLGQLHDEDNKGKNRCEEKPMDAWNKENDEDEGGRWASDLENRNSSRATQPVREDSPTQAFDEAVLQSLNRANTIIKTNELIRQSELSGEEKEPMSESRAMFHRIHRFSVPTKKIEEDGMMCEDIDEIVGSAKAPEKKEPADNLIPAGLKTCTGKTSKASLNKRIFSSNSTVDICQDDGPVKKRILTFEERVQQEERRRRAEERKKTALLLLNAEENMQPGEKLEGEKDKSPKKKSRQIETRAGIETLRTERKREKEQAEKLSRNRAFMEEELNNQLEGIITFYSTNRDAKKDDAILSVVRKLLRRNADLQERGLGKRDKSISGLYSLEEQEMLEIPEPPDVPLYDLSRPKREGPCRMSPVRDAPRWLRPPPTPLLGSLPPSRSGSPTHAMRRTTALLPF